ncbi:Uncharacterised protein [Vibrio cholerae]|nr:Uncharacterised protein [Vibrio cholerae]
MVTKLNAFHYLSITYIQTRNYPFCQHANASCAVNLPSNSARPTITPATPVPFNASISASEPMPPDDWNCTCGY